ncbi:ricin-type beta-trefoil lectin domain protein [Streptacidiphilus anmyonensis]|uniref:ricin-type beta-trefoil lectin domain protein n=1 Tax=Streptacidiphilus anmyonensis TaxID=405782 RepID=UPI000AC674B6|nr:ricin-type beta-trefoil lectin domain protein [Streptacidiphilus anmyonensis]
MNAMLLGFTRADGQARAGQVQVVVDYASIADAYGGGFGSRLEMFRLPACALTTPEVNKCRQRSPLSFSNRADADQLVATLNLAGTSGISSHASARSTPVPMDTSGSMTVVGISSGNAGSQGNYAATSLNPAGTWQATATGAYAYTYPVAMPSPVAGAAPSVGLTYDSQSVDGETSARNSQASWIGDGWDYQPGFIERTYRPCGTLLNSSGTDLLLRGSGDECWGGDNATISFGSHSGTLVPLASTSTDPNLVAQWVLQGDDGTVVQEMKNGDNGLYQGLYYRVLTTDGSIAYFGADHAPSSTAENAAPQSGTPTDPSTNSAWGIPVLHPTSGDPCYSTGTGTASKCALPEGWRWNLDFVISPTGFLQRYDYTNETNWYDLGGGQAAASNGSGTLTQYTRGGQLASISYGYSLQDELTGGANHLPSAQAVFGSAPRCQATSTFDCSAAINTANAPNWPDVPYDLNCNQGDSTTLPPGSQTVPAGVCVTAAPTFWTTTRLSTITTKVNVAGKGLTPVDSYQLTHAYSNAGGAADPITGTSVDPKDAGALQGVMWLQTIQHTGYDASGNKITLNPVTFEGTEVDNRVEGVSNATTTPPPLYRPRISGIQTETGELITVSYNTTPCTGQSLSFAHADSNTNACYPVYWAVPGGVTPIQDWFNKVTVAQVSITDQTSSGTGKTSAYVPNQVANVTAGSAPQVSTYSYGAAAWHRDDSAQTDDQYRTWDQFRGFQTVTVTTGTAPDPVTRSTTTYLQGMNGDYLANGSRRAVTVNATLGGDPSKVLETVTDDNTLAGTALETDTYTHAGGTITEEQVAGPFGFHQTASSSQTPWTDWNTTDHPTGTAPAPSTLPPLLAQRPTSAVSTDYALLADGTTWRQHKTTTGYDSQGRVSISDAAAVDAPFGSNPTPLQETCTTTSYATPSSAAPMMLTYPDQVTTVNTAADSGACPAANSTNNLLLSDEKTYYDGSGKLDSADLPTFGQLGANGYIDATAIATGYDSTGDEQWRTTSATTYDGAGRVTQTLTQDPTGAKPAGLPVTTSYAPSWNPSRGNTNPTQITTTNPQGWTSHTSLDPLRSQETASTDPNGRTTTITYDALGRRTAVWLPGQDQSKGDQANETFSYSINPGAVSTPIPNTDGSITNGGAPTSVTTNTLRDNNGGYATSTTIYDGMLQPRQTQTTPAGDTTNGRVITDTFYDSHGWPAYTYGPHYDSSTAPNSTLVPANENTIASETTNTYDGQGRTTATTLWHDAIRQWQTGTSYVGANQTTTTAPQGGPTTRQTTNALGQVQTSKVLNTNAQVVLTGGQVIPSGTSLMSDSVRLAMQADGNLVIYGLASGKALWASGTSSAGAYAQFGTDGNLAVYNAAGTSLWSTGLTATSGSVLKLQNDANMVIYNSAGTAAWSTKTYQAATEADSATSYTYWPTGQVHTISDTAGNQWSYSYDLLGELTSQTDPNTGTTTLGPYDTGGDLQQSTDGRGQTLSYQYDWAGRLQGEYTGNWSTSPSPANQLTGYTYDSLADGLLTSASRYIGGNTTGGKAYTTTITGYDTAYQPTGYTQDIPATDGFPQPQLPSGIPAAPSGQTRFAMTASYTSVQGLLASLQYGTDGGLPAENLTYAYNQAGAVSSFTSFISTSSTPTYLAATYHDSLGNLQEADYNTLASGKAVDTYAQYDATTNRVTQTSDMAQGVSAAPDVVDYRYDQAGDVTAIDDLQNNTTHDTQCFAYDSFQRLTQAWTDTQGITNAGTAGQQPGLSDAEPGAVGACNTGTPQTSTAPVKTSTIGGPAPYWQTYTYDLLGDRTGMVNHDTTGNALNDTTQSISYAGSNGTAATATPNQAGTTSTSNPGVGSTTQTYGYTDKTNTPSGVNAGNTMTRTLSAGPLSPGIKSTSSGYTGKNLCATDTAGSTTAGARQVVWPCSSGNTSQQYTLGTDGTLKVLGMCLDTTSGAKTAGTGIVINTCNSATTTQKWKTGPNNQLVNTGANNLCLTDPSGSTTNSTQLTVAACGGTGQSWTTVAGAGTAAPGTSETFTYDPEGRTNTVTTTNGGTSQTSTYTYDASGALLEQNTTGTNTKTLYLFGGAEQIIVNAPTGGANALRYYPGPGGVTITRTNTGTLAYQIANAQGTAETSIDANTRNVSRRYFDPYGNPRGTQPTTWVDPSEDHGFLGKPTDNSNGLDLLGARVYDPAQGRFTSPDPLFEANDPNQKGGYTYAADNPSTGSDPTGLMCSQGVDSGGCVSGGNGSASGGGQPNNGQGSQGTDNSSGDTSSAQPAAAPQAAPAVPPVVHWLHLLIDSVYAAEGREDGGGGGVMDGGGGLPPADNEAPPGGGGGIGGGADTGGDAGDEANAPAEGSDPATGTSADPAPDMTTPEGAAENQVDTRGDDQAVQNEVRAEGADEQAQVENDQRGAARAEQEQADAPHADDAIRSGSIEARVDSLGRTYHVDTDTGQRVANPNADPSAEPQWTSQLRRNAWKQVYNDPNSGLDQAQRMQIKARGWAGPTRNNPWTGQLETMELSHEPIPFRDGGTEVVPRWPDEHAMIDPYRILEGNRIPGTNTYP